MNNYWLLSLIRNYFLMQDLPKAADIKTICHKLPKIELHAHLSGCIRVDTLLALAKGK